MAVAFTELTAISEFVTTNLTVYPTPSLTAVANRLYVVLTTASYTSGVTLSSVAGGGLGTWNLPVGATVENSGGNRRMAAAWMQSASPGAAAAIDITWSGACTACGYSVYEITGHHATNPWGNDETAAQNSATALTPTLLSATAGSGILSAVRINAEETITVTDWTAGENNSAPNPSGTIRSAYRTDISDLSCGFTWTTSTVSIGLIIEILAAAAGGGGGNFAPVAMHHRRQQGMS